MVGPRSKGCRRCVERRVKCDETRPACTRCSKLGFECPGFGTHFRFFAPILASNQRTVRRLASSEHSSENNTSDGSRLSDVPNQARPPIASTLLLTTSAIRTSSRELQPLTETRLTGSQPERDTELVDSFVNDLPPRLWYTKNWFTTVCSSLGDPTLKMAVRALATAHGAMVTQDDSLVRLSRLEYGRSLSSLRSTIAHPHPGSMSAMQNSILILGMFELYDKCLAKHATKLTLQSIIDKTDSAPQSEPSTWMYHAMGIEQVMRRQGPTGYDRLDMNRFIYLAMRDTLILLAYKKQARCFLSFPQWQPTHFAMTHPKSLDHAFCVLFATQVKGPSLIHDTRIAILHNSNTTLLKQRALHLRHQARSAMSYFLTELAHLSPLPVEIPSQDIHTPPSYSFVNVRFADVLTPRAIANHHSLIIALNRILREIREHENGSQHAASAEEEEEESRRSATEICKCLPTLEQMPVAQMLGIFSLSYLDFFTERALEGCKREYRGWVEGRRRRWATTTATAS